MRTLIERFPFDYFDIDKVFAFGSVLNGMSDANDIDLLIICDDFDGMSKYKRIEKTQLCLAPFNVDPVCLTNHEFNRLVKLKSETIALLLNNSILIYEK